MKLMEPAFAQMGGLEPTVLSLSICFVVIIAVDRELVIPAQAHVFAMQDTLVSIAQQNNVLIVVQIMVAATQIQEHVFVRLGSLDWIALKRMQTNL